MSHATDLADLATGFTPHPIDSAIRYREAGLLATAPLWQLLDAQVAARPTQLAVTDASVDELGSLTYAELGAAVGRRAAGFAAAGLRPGQRVVLQVNNSLTFAVTALGLIRAGVVPVMALPAHRIAEIAHLAVGADAVAYISEDGRRGFDFRDLARELVSLTDSLTMVFIDGDHAEFAPLPDADPAAISLPDSADPDLPALFLVSGGTTGLPKLIARTHADYTFNATRSAQICGLTNADTMLVALPAAHNFPLCCPGFLGILTVGGHTVFTDNPSPDSAFEVIEKYRVTAVALVPALAQLWCAATEWEEADRSSLRLFQVGGAKLAEPDAQAIDLAFGDVVQQVFGMAEGLICYTRRDDDRATIHRTQGRPMCEADDVRIVDENGAQVPDGVDGELLVRGPYTIRGYYRAAEHNQRSFTADGYYRSGDLVRRLPTGDLIVTGRIKDTIVRAGENVAADDIEENLLTHPGIAQVAVVGLPDPVLGEKICVAAVSPIGFGDELPRLADLRRYLADRGLAAFKLPDDLRFVSALPVTAVGKIDKVALRGRLTEATTPA
ncbi:AMP-binding protein [Gordonia sp. ABSL1-1]|uniref:(2,3-dihydroxybenzoyl)adenylate synthase n=1 Tax=Gordonia sp. ABSL1-1 TaxID=3053923 RepID=UPI002572A64D|nr:AMP-binding protein [Gordonia sp. ABSL1-1]MDL9937480.1 AMP-binding protein [Gordonia sp. ABSL1-1]